MGFHPSTTNVVFDDIREDHERNLRVKWKLIHGKWVKNGLPSWFDCHVLNINSMHNFAFEAGEYHNKLQLNQHVALARVHRFSDLGQTIMNKARSQRNTILYK